MEEQITFRKAKYFNLFALTYIKRNLIITHSFNPNTWEADTGRSLCIPGHPEYIATSKMARAVGRDQNSSNNENAGNANKRNSMLPWQLRKIKTVNLSLLLGGRNQCSP